MELRQEAQIYEMPHLLTYYECDETGHPSMSMLLGMISMVSDEHSLSLGMNTQAVHETGGTWVVSGYEGQLAKKQPVFGETVILGTRAVAYNRFFALREFWVTDQERRVEYARIKSIFVFMNLASRRMESIPAAMIEPYQAPLVTRIPRLKRPHKLDVATAVQAQEYHVRYFDIDANHHVNNARYFDWLLDPLGRDFLNDHRPQNFNLQYLQEVRAGELVTSQVHAPVASGHTSCHQINVGNKLAAIAEIDWY